MMAVFRMLMFAGFFWLAAGWALYNSSGTAVLVSVGILVCFWLDELKQATDRQTQVMEDFISKIRVKK